MFAGNGGAGLVNLLILVTVATVLGSRDPQARLAAVKGLVLARKVYGLTSVLAAVAAALGEGAGARRELRRDGGVLLNPVGEGVFAVLNNPVRGSINCTYMCSRCNLRLRGLVSVVRLAGLTGCDRSIVDQFEEVLSVAGNNGKLLAVLAHGIKLVSKGSLELLTSDVGQLSLGDEGLGFSTHKLLLKNDNLGRVGLLVLQLSDLVGNLLLA